MWPNPSGRCSVRWPPGLYGALPDMLDGLRATAVSGSGREAWISQLRTLEAEKRSGEAAELADPRAPLHPMRIYGELAKILDRDAVIVGDGGDFVSYAGRMVDSYEPGCWVDPGPYGCLGQGRGTRWPRSWPGRSVRWFFWPVTARSGSPGWSWTRWPGTTFRWWW